MYLTGSPDPGPPVRANPYTGDYISALFALWSSLAAYIHRLRTGHGQVVDVAQFEAVHQILAGTMVQYFSTGTLRQRTGNKSPAFQPYDTFRARDGWVVLGAVGGVFDRACRVVGLDPRTCAAAKADVNGAEGLEFDAHVRSWIAARSVDEVVRAFNAAQVGCCPVMSAEDMAKDPHFEAREAHIEWEDLQVGHVKGTGLAPKFSRTPGKVWRGSVPVGHDNDVVYREVLGLAQHELEDLKRRKVV